MIKEVEIWSNSYNVNGKMVYFPLHAHEGILMNDRIIVTFDYDDIKEKFPELEYSRAVWCYNFEGDLLWRVAPPYYIDSDTGEKVIWKNEEREYIVAINGVKYWEEEDIIVVYGFVGYEVDPLTGKLGDIVYRERGNPIEVKKQFYYS